ncbi:MAG: hypothetical protein ACUVRK_02550 [Spirochaetota bacterium]
MNTIFQNKTAVLILVFGFLFGILAAIAAYVNAYEGYSHFPDISKSKKIRISLSIAVSAFCIILAGIIIAIFFVYYDNKH